MMIFIFQGTNTTPISFYTSTLSLVLLIFFPCYFSNIFTERNFNLRLCAYQSNWIDIVKVNYKHYNIAFLIFMERLNRQEEFLVGRMFYLNLATFAAVKIFWKNFISENLFYLHFQIIKFAYQFYAVLMKSK